jgi:Na+/pantothenate symporter
VASAIWPIVFGLYYRKTTALAASLSMIAGSTLGLIAYFTIGFYVAALVSSAVSLAVIVALSFSSKNEFDLQQLANTGNEP